MFTLKKDENHSLNKLSKILQLNGKYYEIDDSINLKEHNLVLPNNDKRNHFKVTLLDDILFYHDSDVIINQNDPKMKTIIKQIILNTPLDLINNNSLAVKVEILVTKVNKSELKFERLHKSTFLSAFSLIVPYTPTHIQTKFPKLTKFLNNHKKELKKPNTDFNNNSNNADYGLIAKINNLNIQSTNTMSNQITNNTYQSAKRNVKAWHINDWLKMANKKQTNSNVSYNVKDNNHQNQRQSSSHKETDTANREHSETTIHLKSIISDKEKEKILNFIGKNLPAKDKIEISKNESIKTTSSNKEDNVIKSFNKIELSIKNDDKHHKKEQQSLIYDCCSSSSTRRTVTNTRSSLSISIQTNNDSGSNSFTRSSSCNRDFKCYNLYTNDNNYNKRNSLLINPNETAIIDYFERKQLEWKNVPFQLIDSHCHFDILFSKLRFDESIREYFEIYKHFYLDNFEACINVICDPFKYYTRDRFRNYLNRFGHEKVYFTIGCHPHFAESWNQKVENILYDLVKEKRIIAIGECGLDVSKKNNVSLDVQIEVFTAQLIIAKYFQLPIVIHCRDTEEEVYEILKKHLSPKHRIHLHCFTGSWQIAKSYLDTFENLCIGVTSLVTFSSKINPDFVELVRNIPLNRLLLETDSPYFLPQSDDFPIGIDYCHPGFVFATAESIAKLKNVSLERIIINTRYNAKRVYGI